MKLSTQDSTEAAQSPDKENIPDQNHTAEADKGSHVSVVQVGNGDNMLISIPGSQEAPGTPQQGEDGQQTEQPPQRDDTTTNMQDINTTTTTTSSSSSHDNNNPAGN